MNEESEKRLGVIEAKVDAIYVSVEKTRKYFLWTMVATLIIVVLPAIGLLFAIPAFLTTYVGGLSGL